jgi:sugar transferase (PEP-CTERM/EpsH1 system associated)
MNLLFLSHRMPFPPNKGDKIRSHALLRHLAQKHKVYLGCFVDEEADMQYADAVRTMAGGECMLLPLTRQTKLLRSFRALINGSSITTEVYRCEQMQTWVNHVIADAKIDCAVVFSSSMTPYLLQNPVFSPRRGLFDMVDLDSDKWLQYSKTAAFPLSWIYAREARKLLQLEREAAERFALTYLVSDFEADSFARLAPESRNRIRALSNGVDLDYFSPGEFRSPYPQDITPIVMSGRMDYWPNVDGAIWFANSVLPAVKDRIPNAKFYVVGAEPAPSLRTIASSNVEIVGEVADIRPYIATARVVVAPLRIARGVQNKVLEALAMCVPTVATYEASRALGVTNGKDIRIANDAADFADAVIAAASAADRTALAANGRSYVTENHNWSRLFSALDHDLQNLCRQQG